MVPCAVRASLRRSPRKPRPGGGNALLIDAPGGGWRRYACGLGRGVRPGQGGAGGRVRIVGRGVCTGGFGRLAPRPRRGSGTQPQKCPRALWFVGRRRGLSGRPGRGPAGSVHHPLQEFRKPCLSCGGGLQRCFGGRSARSRCPRERPGKRVRCCGCRERVHGVANADGRPNRGGGIFNMLVKRAAAKNCRGVRLRQGVAAAAMGPLLLIGPDPRILR